MIYFVGGIRKLDDNKASQEKSKLQQSHPPITAPAENQMIHPSIEDINAGHAVDIGKVEKAKGGKTVFEIISEIKNLAGKNILLRAKVTRFTPNIMGKNWIHRHWDQARAQPPNGATRPSGFDRSRYMPCYRRRAS